MSGIEGPPLRDSPPPSTSWDVQQHVREDAFPFIGQIPIHLTEGYSGRGAGEWGGGSRAYLNRYHYTQPLGG